MVTFYDLYKMHQEAEEVCDGLLDTSTYDEALKMKIIDNLKYGEIMHKQNDLIQEARQIMVEIVINVNDSSSEDIIEEMSKAYTPKSFTIIGNSKMKELIDQACTDEETYHQEVGEGSDNPYSEIRYQLQKEYDSRTQ